MGDRVLAHSATAGTTESSDVRITVAPSTEGIHITLHSEVAAAYGEQIATTVRDVLARYSIASADVVVDDKGALDCTIRARTNAAIQRGLDEPHDVDWKAISHE